MTESDTGSPLRILYVDDASELQKRGFLRLLGYRGYSVDDCVSPEEAVMFLRKSDNPYDVVVTDLAFTTSHNNGYDLAKSVKDNYPSARTIVFTGWLRDRITPTPENGVFATVSKLDLDNLMDVLNNLNNVKKSL